MTFAEKLQHSSLSDDEHAKMVCSLLDYLDSVRCCVPSERQMADIMGMTRYKLRMLLDSLEGAGVLSMKAGKGRSKNTYGKSADVISLEQRQNQFKQKCWESLFRKYKWFVIEKFFDVWGEADIATGKMRYEKEKTFEITKRIKRFTIDGVVVQPATTKEEIAEVVRINTARAEAVAKQRKNKYYGKSVT